jgi:hypothetical protein
MKIHSDKGAGKTYYMFLDSIAHLVQTEGFNEILDFSACFQYKDKMGLWVHLADRPSIPITTAQKVSTSHPYNSVNQHLQAHRLRPAVDVLSTCTDQQIQPYWRLFAHVEQSRYQTIVSPIPDLFSTAQYKHACLRLFECPIGSTADDEGSREVYCDTHFPVLTVHALDNKALDICSRFRFFQGVFISQVTPGLLKQFNERIEMNYKGGYFSSVSEPENETMLAQTERLLDGLKEIVIKPIASESKQDPVPMQQVPNPHFVSSQQQQQQQKQTKRKRNETQESSSSASSNSGSKRHQPLHPSNVNIQFYINPNPSFNTYGSMADSPIDD